MFGMQVGISCNFVFVNVLCVKRKEEMQTDKRPNDRTSCVSTCCLPDPHETPSECKRPLHESLYESGYAEPQIGNEWKRAYAIAATGDVHTALRVINRSQQGAYYLTINWMRVNQRLQEIASGSV